MADSLATEASNFQISIFSNKNFEIHVKHWPTVPDNLWYWELFLDDQQVNNFMQSEGEFENCAIGKVYKKYD